MVFVGLQDKLEISIIIFLKLDALYQNFLQLFSCAMDQLKNDPLYIRSLCIVYVVCLLYQIFYRRKWSPKVWSSTRLFLADYLKEKYRLVREKALV